MLEPDVALLLARRQKELRQSRRQVINDALRLGLQTMNDDVQTVLELVEETPLSRAR